MNEEEITRQDRVLFESLTQLLRLGISVKFDPELVSFWDKDVNIGQFGWSSDSRYPGFELQDAVSSLLKARNTL